MIRKWKQNTTEKSGAFVSHFFLLTSFISFWVSSESIRENILWNVQLCKHGDSSEWHHLRSDPSNCDKGYHFTSFIHTESDGFCIFLLNLKAWVNNVHRSAVVSATPTPHSHTTVMIIFFHFIIFLFFFLILIFLYINNTNIYGEKMFTEKKMIFMTLNLFHAFHAVIFLLLLFLFFRNEKNFYRRIGSVGWDCNKNKLKKSLQVFFLFILRRFKFA